MHFADYVKARKNGHVIPPMERVEENFQLAEPVEKESSYVVVIPPHKEGVRPRILVMKIDEKKRAKRGWNKPRYKNVRRGGERFRKHSR